MTDFGEGTWHVGNKDHRCEWCGQTIPKGEKFYHYKGMYGGEWQNWRMHEECYEDHELNADDNDREFTPYEAERPAKLDQIMCKCGHDQMRHGINRKGEYGRCDFCTACKKFEPAVRAVPADEREGAKP